MVSRFHLLVLAAVAVAFTPAVMGQKATFLDSFGASGTADGQFSNPSSIAYDSRDDSVYIADTGNHRIQQLSATGVFQRKWGSQGFGLGQFDFPAGISFTPRLLGYIVVADTVNHRIQTFSNFLGIVHEDVWGSFGSGSSQFNQPSAIAVSRDGSEVYVTDNGNHRVQRFSLEGAYLGQWGSEGTGPGQFKNPHGIAVHPLNGDVFVSELLGGRVQQFSAGGQFKRQIGSPGFEPGQLMSPEDVAVDTAGRLFVSQSGTQLVSVFASNGSFLFRFGSLGSGIGQFRTPRGVSLSGDGILFITDTGNNRIVRYRISDEAPKLVVKGAKTRTVASSSVRLSGTARDDLEVDFVEVKVGSAPFRKAKGSSKWTFTARELKTGSNRVQIRAVDLGGRKSKLETLRVSHS